MSKTVHISSASQFNGLLQSSKIVVADCKLFTRRNRHYTAKCPSITYLLLLYLYEAILNPADTLIVYADWCGPCKQIAPIYEQLSAQLSRPNKVTFVKVNTDTQQDVAQKYKVTASVYPQSA